MNQLYVVAGIDVHKKMLAVVVAVVGEQKIEYRQRKFGTTSRELEQLAAWLREQQVSEVAMESTAQYWRPVWMVLEGQFRLHLAQPRSTQAPRGRKSDFADAKRIVRRLLAEDLTLSYVPDREQRQWRTMTRMRVRMSTQQVRLRNQMEGVLEEGRIKLSSVVSDLVGVSGRRILWALVGGETDPVKLASLAEKRLHCTAEQLQEALRGELDLGSGCCCRCCWSNGTNSRRTSTNWRARWSWRCGRGKMPCSVCGRSPESAALQRSRSWRKWDPRLALFWARRNWPPGSGYAPESRKVPRSPTPLGRPKEIGCCAAC